MAKAPNWNEPDGEYRKPGARTGLDTRVVLAVNDVDLVLEWPRAAPVPKGSC